ncbi:hypothetical protein NW766_003240 [Fusarium irregulare]|uniref:Uncharacterized protein n=1 Tax=Fusarium irregulare TaxID=2494466 RepID=A0A9W8PVV8_9HYPO|nr:hypothetical protein NW766_003240 [Fusarium irregulare]
MSNLQWFIRLHKVGYVGWPALSQAVDDIVLRVQDIEKTPTVHPQMFSNLVVRRKVHYPSTTEFNKIICTFRTTTTTQMPSNLIGHKNTADGSWYAGDFLFIQMRSLHIRAMREIIIKEVEGYRRNIVALKGLRQANGPKRSSATLAAYPFFQTMAEYLRIVV